MQLQFSQKKLRETKFFLEHLQYEAKRTAGEFEQFDFYLSAFFNAAISTIYALHKEGKGQFKQWLNEWEKHLSQDNRTLWEFIPTQRHKETHEGIAEKDENKEGIPVYTTYDDKFGHVEVFAPPAVLSGLSGPPATIFKPIRYFRIKGKQQEVTQVCKRHADLLERLVNEFIKA